MTCRHCRAWPSIMGDSGIMWCPDCGAIRTISRIGPGSFSYAEPYWIRPGPTWQADFDRNLKAVGRARQAPEAERTRGKP